MGKHILVSSDNESNITNESSENAYLVEVITKAKVVDDDEFEYRVKWYGYTSDDDTWEPEENVAECTRLLKCFWKEVGKQHKKSPGPRGTVYTASDEWIRKERRHFRKEMLKDQAEKAAKRKERERERSNRTKAAKSAAEDDAPTKSRSTEKADVLSLFTDPENSSEADETPLSAQLNSKRRKEKEMQRTTSGITKASSSKIKSGIPKKLSIQTSSAPKGKYSGLKIPKKAPGSVQASPINSPVIPSKDAFKPKPKTPLSTTLPNRPFNAVFKEHSVRNSEPSNVFLPPRPRPTAPVVSPVGAPQASYEDVDNLLATIMPFGHSEAQKPENLSSVPSKTPTVVPSGLKFAKKWSWSGELFFDTSDAAERLCDITIHDPSETSDVGFRLGPVLDSRDSLRFSKAYRRSELNFILQALRKVDQIAKISHREEHDKEPLSVFMKYLARRNLTISSAVITSFGHVAEMIVFPSTDKDLCKRLNVPLRYEVADCLLLALMPWHVPPSKYGVKYLRSDELRDSKVEGELEEMRKAYSSIVSKPNIETSFRILGYDFWFINFLPSRKYCIWSFHVDAKPTDRGRKIPGVRQETKALIDVLSFLKAENVGYDSADVRVVFIHVGSVRSIRKLPGLVERRCDKPEVRFVTYGTHESVRPSLWGFREIYPLGGVVTFTASALLENPLRAAELIEQIHKHPHWECYILPSVLAVFVRLSCPGEDPLSVHAREPYHFGRILGLIEEGKVALMQSPGLIEGSLPGIEDSEGERDKWIATQFTTLAKTPLQHLEECWSTFVSEYSNKTETELRASIESEIVKDLTRLQTQQAIRENYRRFVVIKAMQDEHINSQKEGFEWRTAQDFNFGDGFPVQSVDSMGEIQQAV